MARRNTFNLKVDITAIEGLADRLQNVDRDELGAQVVVAINDVLDSSYNLVQGRMLSGINLTESYINTKMRRVEATRQRPAAEIVAPTGAANTTSLSHYGAMQLTKPVNWTNAQIAADGHKFGKWPGWTRRKGLDVFGIAVDRKAAGRSVEVVKGRRKTMGPNFGLPGRNDSEGNPLVFSRVKGSKKIESLVGPSVYQLLRVAAGELEGEVTDNLEVALIQAAERAFEKAMK